MASQRNMDVITAVPRGLNIIKNFLPDRSAIRRLIDLEEELMLQCGEKKTDGAGSKAPDQTTKQSKCAGEAEPGKDPHTDPCTDLCAPQKTSITLEEITPPRPLVAPYAKPVVLGEEIVIGRAFPIKFRIRKRPGSNKDCEMENHLLCTPTENTNVVLLTNCCDVLVWPSQRVEEMNKVAVTLISGVAQLTEYVLEEQALM